MFRNRVSEEQGVEEEEERRGGGGSKRIINFLFGVDVCLNEAW